MTDLFNKNMFCDVIRDMCYKKMLPTCCAFFIPDHLKTHEMCSKVVVCHPKMLDYMAGKLKTQKMYIKATVEGDHFS